VVLSLFQDTGEACIETIKKIKITEIKKVANIAIEKLSKKENF
jgi:hypothetical protein